MDEIPIVDMEPLDTIPAPVTVNQMVSPGNLTDGTQNHTASTTGVILSSGQPDSDQGAMNSGASDIGRGDCADPDRRDNSLPETGDVQTEGNPKKPQPHPGILDTQILNGPYVTNETSPAEEVPGCAGQTQIKTAENDSNPRKNDNGNLETSNHGDSETGSHDDQKAPDSDEEIDTRCGYGPCKPSWLQRFNTPFTLLMCLCWYTLLEATIILGAIYVNMATIERRYELSSTQVAWIPATQDLVGGVFTLVFGFLGTFLHKGRLVTFGALMYCFGCVFFLFPHIFGDNYTLGTYDDSICDEYGNSTDCYIGSSKYSAAYSMFIIGQCFNAFAGATLYTLSIPYLDDNIKTKNSPVYIAAIFAMSAMGTTVGYVLGGYFLSFYVDVGRVNMDTISITPSDPRWVGAWWIIFVVGLIGGAISVLILGWWPKELPTHKKYKNERVSEVHQGSAYAEDDKSTTKLGYLKMQLKSLFLNPAYVLLTVGGIFESGIIIAFTVYLPKIIQFQFVMNASEAGIIAGAVLVPAAAIGQMVGGIIPSYFNLKIRGQLTMLIITSVIVCCLSPVLLLRCPTPPIAGVFVSYDNSSVPISTAELDQPCNSDCHCTTESYDPICGVNGLEYFSPCYAGCLAPGDSGNTYVGCACINPGNTNASYQQADSGICQEDCNYFIIFLSVFFVIVFMVFIGANAAVSITVRVVPDKSKSFAMGMTSTLSRFLGTVPFPIILGKIFDRSCMVWQEACGDKGSCWIYSTEDLALGLFITGLGCKLTATIFYVACICIYKAPPPETVELIVSSVDSDGMDSKEKIVPLANGIDDQITGAENKGFVGEMGNDSSQFGISRDSIVSTKM